MSTNAVAKPVRTHEHDPDAILVYGIDYTNWLAEIADDATIQASSWSVDDGIEVLAESVTANGKKATIRLGSATAGGRYYARSRVTGPDGQRDDRTILLVCVER